MITTHQKTTFLQTLMHLLKANIGTGILAMPSAFHNSGLLIGAIGIPILGIICTICVHMLISSNDILCKKLNIVESMDYEVVAEKSCLVGPKCVQKHSKIFSKIVSTFLSLTQFGICCSYAIFTAENIKKSAIEWHLVEGEGMSTVYYLLMIWPILVVLNFVRSIKALSVVSAFANILQLIGLMIIGFNLSMDLPPISSRPAIGNSIPLFFSTAIFAFEGIGVCLPIYIPMKKPETFASPFGVVNVGFTIVGICYFGIGFLGYLKYGPEVLGSITLNMPNSIIFKVTRLMFAVAILLTHPLALFVPIKMALPIIYEFLHANNFITDKNKLASNFVEYLFRTLLVTLSVLVAASIPRVDLIISLVGAVASSMVCLVFPPILKIFSFWEEKHGLPKTVMVITCILFTSFGMICTVLGTYYSTEAIVKSFINNELKHN